MYEPVSIQSVREKPNCKIWRFKVLLPDTVRTINQ
jgi:hypothetical protein